jgi:hypothetical protein
LVIQPSSFSIHHSSRRHVFALDIHETQIRSEIAAALPERRRMEMKSLPVDERCTIDIYRSPESVWMRIGNEVIHSSTPIVRVHAQKVATLNAIIVLVFRSHIRAIPPVTLRSATILVRIKGTIHPSLIECPSTNCASIHVGRSLMSGSRCDPTDSW